MKKILDGFSYIFLAPLVLILAPFILPIILLAGFAQLFNTEEFRDEV